MTSARPALLVQRTGPLLTVQDLGRPGLAHLGVPESGALDQPSLRLANRLVGNPDGAAGLEVTAGGAVLRALGPVLVALTGAPLAVRAGGRARGLGEVLRLEEGQLLELGLPVHGVRTCLAVRGGIAGREVLGSASTDLLSGLGAPLRAGDRLRVGPPGASSPARVDTAAQQGPGAGPVRLRAVPGPRHDWFVPGTLRGLASTVWTVDARSNRVGLRLRGEPLERSRDDELASEGTVAGAVQVPSDGSPVLFLADHPVTGGYPVVAVVVTRDLPLAAQAAPGQEVVLDLLPVPDLAPGESGVPPPGNGPADMIDR